MRILSSALCATVLFASAVGSASAVPSMMAGHENLLLGPEVHGTISGANGKKLDCAGTTAEIHADGKKIGTYPTTSNGQGGCAFSEHLAGISSKAMITSCAGKVSFGEMSERVNFAATRTVTGAHEMLGTVGAKSVYSTFASGGAGGASPLNVTVGTEQ